MSKRIISMLLAICMVLGMFPTQVFAAEPKVTVTMSGYEVGANINAFDAKFSNGSSPNPVFFMDEDQNPIESGKFEAGKTYYAYLSYYNSEVGIDGVAAYTAADFALEGIEGAEATTEWFADGSWMWVIVKLPQLTEAAAEPKVTLKLEGFAHGNAYSDVKVATETAGVEVALATIQHKENGQENLSGYLVGGKQYYLRTRVQGTDLSGYTVEDLALDGVNPTKITHYTNAIEAWFTLPVLDLPEGMTDVTFSVEGYEIGSSVKDIVVTRSDVNAKLTYNSEVFVYVGEDWDNPTETFKADTDYLVNIFLNSYVAGDVANAKLVGLTEEPIALDDEESDIGDTYADLFFKLPQLTEAAAPTTYGITVSESEKGTVTADKEEAKEGDTVTLTVTPAEGYELESLTYTPEGGEAVDITEAKSFTMPASSVTVAATFKAASPKVVLKLEGYEVMADAASVTLSGEDCNFLDSNGIYKAMMPSTINKVSGSLLPGTQYYLYFNFNSISGADWSALTKDDVSLEGLCDTAESLNNGYAYVYKNMTGWFVLPMLEVPDDANVIIEAENGKVYPSTYKATAGETVTLTATADDGYVLKAITATDEDGNAVTVNNDFTFVMPTGKVTVSAVFEKAYVKWIIGEVSGVPGGTVQVPVSVDTNLSGVVQVRITPKYDSSVLSYPNNDATDVTLAENCSFSTIKKASVQYDGSAKNRYQTEVLTEGVTLPEAPLFYITYKIADTAADGTSSEISLYGTDNRNGSALLYANNKMFTYEATVIPGKVTVDETAASTTYGITVNTTENGKVEANKETAAAGEAVTLTVTPAEGYELDTLTVTDADGAAVTLNEDNTFTMPASAVTVNASFKLKPVYAVTVNDATNGTVTADKEEAYEGATVTLTVAPNKGYGLETMTVDGADVTDKVSGGKYTFTMPAKAVEVSATFVEDPYPYRINLKLTGYEVGKVAKYASATMYDTNGTDVTAGEWYCCVVDSNEGNNWNIGELKANTRYWLRIERYISGYQASDFGLLDMEAVSVTDSSASGNFLIYIELPMLEASANAVTVNAATSGTVTADKAEAKEGETVTLTVTPAEGYELESLTYTPEGGEAVDITEAKSFTMPASAVTVNASFKLLPVTYAVTVSEMLGGTVTADKATAAEGATVTLTIKADDYYALDTLTVTDAAGNEVTVTDNAFTMPAGAVTVSATFKQTSGMEQYFTVTVDGVEYPAQYIGVQYYDDANRDCEAFLVKLPEGTTKMTVDANYKLYVLDMTNLTIANGNDPIELAVNGAVTIYKLNSYVGTNSPHYCYLRVELPSYDITLNTPENGKLKADKTVAVKGETVTLTVTPNKGYELESLTVPGAEVTKVDDVTYTFPMPGADTEVTAVFKEIPPEYYGIILNETVNGTVTADKTEAVMGDTVNLTISPAEGYRVDTVTVLNASGAKVAVAEDYSFTMPGSPVDVTVTFKVNAKVYIKLENYELGKKGNQVKATMTLADGSAYTTDYWYIHTATDMNSYYKGELQANTKYWLCVQTGNTKYKASDFALEGMDAVSVVDQSDSSQMLFFIELPMLKEPAPTYQIDTTIYNGTVKAYIDGKEVTEASAGQTVTLVVTPDEGYTLTDFYVMNRYTDLLPITKIGDNTYTFVMPETLVLMEAWFSPYIVEGNSVVTLSDKRGALPGDLVYIPVTVTAPPSGSFYIFDLDVRLPEGWVIEGAVEGRDSRLNSTDYWMATPTQAGRWGLIAQYAGNAGVGFPEGEVLILKIRVPADAQPGTYKLDAVAASLTMNQIDSVASSFGQYVDGYVSVKAKPEQKIKLDTPEITDGMIRWYEDLVESRNIPACQQDTNAVVQYRLAESEDGLESAEWITGVVPPDDPRDDTTDSITWIEKVMPYWETNYGSLKANTKYYLQIRYSADNTTCYEDSDPYEMEFTTKAWIEEPVEISTTGAITSPGESFTVTVSLDHVFGDKEFFQKDLSLAFNNEYFTLTNFTKTNFGGSTLPEGEVAELTFTVNDNVAPGEYQLDLTTADPIYLRYSRDGSDYYKHLRQYPVNHEFVSGTITVLEAMDAPVLTDASAGENSIEVTAPVTLDGVKVEYAISTDKGQTWSAWQESNVFEDLTVNTEYQIRARYVPDGTSSKFGPSAPSEAITAKTSYDDITVSISGGEVLPGDTVTVSVAFEHELTKEAEAVSLSFEYDEKLLKLDSAVIDEKLGLNLRKIADVYEIYSNEAFTVPEGDVITLTFQALESASGDVAIAPTIEVYLNDTDLMNVEKTEETAVVHIHKVKVLEAVKVTCTTDGLTEGEQCELCQQILTEQEFIEAEGHKYESKVTKPTCLTVGYTTYTCECGDTYYDEIEEANGHSCEAAVTAPTCEDMGYTTYECKNCDFSYINDLKDALGHKEETVKGTAATCTEDGKTDGSKCSVCGEILKAQETVKAPGHKETVVGKKEATEEAEGYTGDTVCSVCETVLVKGEVIAKLEPSECICAPFTDVDTSKWYHEAVDFVLEAKLMNGTSDTTFAPLADTNRAMLATLLYRMEGEPSVAGMENPFTDVPAGKWYTDAVIWAANEGVVKGTSTTTFTPDQKITREQMVTMLWRYAGEPEADEAAMKNFTDAATVSNYAKEAMAWAIETGLVSGVSNTTIAPKGTANRAQIATILMRYASK